MHNRHGIIGKSVIESVRRSLQNKYAEDRHIQQLIEELDSTEDLTYEELHITRQAYEEVKARLFIRRYWTVCGRKSMKRKTC